MAQTPTPTRKKPTQPQKLTRKPKTKISAKPVAKKKLVQQGLFEICQKRKNFIFDNDLVKRVASKNNFGNPFDATKIDSKSTLAPIILAKGYCIAHLGGGKHKFIKAADKWFHEFEDIETDTIEWPYRKSALNETDASESNILSVGFNQRIIHDFLYEDIVASPKMYGARRTKFSAKYKVGKERIDIKNSQIEIDLTTEYLGHVTVFEGKNNFPENFAVYQLFMPFLYFSLMKKKKEIDIQDVSCCFLRRKKDANGSLIRLHQYTFTDFQDLGSLKLIKSAEYRLVQR